MKKIMFGLIAVGMITLSSRAVQAQKQVPPPLETTVQSNTEAAEVVLPEQPKFASEAANNGLSDFSKLVKEYAPAIKAQDTAKAQEFSAKVNAWQQGAAGWLASLSPEEQTQLQAYMQKVGQVLQP